MEPSTPIDDEAGRAGDSCKDLGAMEGNGEQNVRTGIETEGVEMGVIGATALVAAEEASIGTAVAAGAAVFYGFFALTAMLG